MAKSKETFNKKEKEKKRLKKRKEKEERKLDRKATSQGGGLENMIAWVDENGNISDTPPENFNPVMHGDEDLAAQARKRADDIREENTKQGKLEFMNEEKGFGFIKEARTGEKYFIHIKNLPAGITLADTLIFEAEISAKGKAAVNVKKKM